MLRHSTFLQRVFLSEMHVTQNVKQAVEYYRKISTAGIYEGNK